jgi:hypothetical protein
MRIPGRLNFARRHDALSVIRQRVIANLACTVTVFLVALHLVASHVWRWHITVPTGAAVAFWLCFGLGWAGLLACSSLPIGLHRNVALLNSAWSYEPGDEPAWLARVRKYVYYPSGYLIFFSLAILIEVSGGVVASPFTAVLFALVLTAQQLGRFKLNSFVSIISAILITGALGLYQSLFGIQHEPAAPRQLTFALLAFAFLLTAVCTHVTKARNYRAAGVVPQPTHAALCQDAAGRWLYALYDRQTRLDSALACPPETTMADARQEVERIIESLVPTGYERTEWHGSHAGDEAAGYVRRNRG